jgi:hypothetical protein
MASRVARAPAHLDLDFLFALTLRFAALEAARDLAVFAEAPRFCFESRPDLLRCGMVVPIFRVRAMDPGRGRR